ERSGYLASSNANAPALAISNAAANAMAPIGFRLGMLLLLQRHGAIWSYESFWARGPSLSSSLVVFLASLQCAGVGPLLVEIAQVGWPLASFCRHQEAVGAHHVGFVADFEVFVAFGAHCFDEDRIRHADIALLDGPRTG